MNARTSALHNPALMVIFMVSLAGGVGHPEEPPTRTGTPGVSPEGFVAIFNGRDLDGWTTRQAKEGDFRSNLHRGGIARVADISDRERDIAVKAAQTLGLDVAGVDLLRATRGPLVMEVNASPGLEGVEKTTGVDIAGKMIAWIERHATPGYCLKTGG